MKEPYASRQWQHGIHVSFFEHSSCCFSGLFVGKQGSCVGLYMSNRAEWVVAELACCAYSYVSVPLYDTLGMFDLKMYSKPTQEKLRKKLLKKKKRYIHYIFLTFASCVSKVKSFIHDCKSPSRNLIINLFSLQVLMLSNTSSTTRKLHVSSVLLTNCK